MIRSVVILDLGVESLYLGIAYADDPFEKRVVEELLRAGLGRGDIPILQDTCSRLE